MDELYLSTLSSGQCVRWAQFALNLWLKWRSNCLSQNSVVQKGSKQQKSVLLCHFGEVIWDCILHFTLPWHTVINISWVKLYKRCSAPLPWNLWTLSWICLYDGNHVDTGHCEYIVNKTHHLKQPTKSCMSSFYVNALVQQNRKT